MRRIVAFNRVSADGYFSPPDGNLGWVVPDDEIDKGGAEGTSGADTILFGRRTYEMFESFWPKVADQSSAPDPHAAGRQSPELAAMAKWINNAAKVVFSKSLKDVTWKNSRLARDLDPRAIAAMKKERGKDIMIFGSGTVASQLTEHGLIDEYHFIVGPIILGSGRPLISGVPRSPRLDLVECREYKSGNVMLRYARVD